MPFAVHLPPPSLRPFVAEAHGYRVPANPTGLHRGLPSRHLTLVVELVEPLKVSGLGRPVAAHGVVGGLHVRPALIDASGRQEGVQYALTPAGTRALLGVPAAELAGSVVDLADLAGAGAADLVAQLRETGSWPERFRLIDAELLRRLGDRPALAPVPAEVAEAWRVVFATDGRVRLAAVADHVGWGRRHLSEKFRLVTGLTPKQAARIARFEAARRALVAQRQPGLAELAARCGFADQSHLSREWRALAGCSIVTWLREELPFVQDGTSVTSAESPA